jgi:hypothetical protein
VSGVVPLWNSLAICDDGWKAGSVDFTRKNARWLCGIGVACSGGIMRNLAIVVVVASLFASTAAVSVKQQRRWTEKLDVALVHAAEQGGADPVRALIQVQPGATDRLMSHLVVQHGLKPAPAATSDLVAVQLPGSMLRSVAADPDVLRLSSDSGD